MYNQLLEILMAAAALESLLPAKITTKRQLGCKLSYSWLQMESAAVDSLAQLVRSQWLMIMLCLVMLRFVLAITDL